MANIGSGTAGKVLISGGNNSSAFGSITSSDNILSVTSGASSINFTAGSALSNDYLHPASFGTAGQILTSNGVGVQPSFQAAPASSPLTTKGDLYTYSTTNDRLAVGTNEHCLIADSSQATGNKWGVLQEEGGGTGQSTYSTGNILYASGTNTLSKLAPPVKPGCPLIMGFDNSIVWLNPSEYFYIYDDFIGQTQNGQTNWRQTLTAGTARFTQDSLNNHPGELQYESDASTTAVMGISKIDVDGTGNFKAGAYRQYHEFLCKLSALSDGTDTYIFRVGLGDDRDLTTIAQGCWFEYTHSVNSGNFTIKCANTSTTTANTSTAATTTYTKYGIEINAAGTSVAFKINDVEVANSPIVADIPTGDFSPFFSFQKTAGTTERIMLIDYYYAFGQFTTPR